MIVAAGFCPHPPALVPAVGGAAAAELGELRAACQDVVKRLVATGAQLVLLGSGDRSRLHSPLARGDFAAFGVPYEVPLGSPACGGAVELPLSLTVGAWLLREVAGPRTNALAASVGPEYPGSRAAADLLGQVEQRDVALLVLGDGTARRAVEAPDRVDRQADAFDAAVTAALRGGDPGALTALDPALGAELLAAGLPAWRAAADLISAPVLSAELLYAEVPFGVSYAVAFWSCA